MSDHFLAFQLLSVGHPDLYIFANCHNENSARFATMEIFGGQAVVFVWSIA
jgi:hypothetical protein